MAKSVERWRPGAKLALIALWVLCNLSPRLAAAVEGDIDPSVPPFVLPLPPLANGDSRGVRVRIQNDGRVVVLAEYRHPGAFNPSALLIYRLLPTGGLDSEFAMGGMFVFDNGGGELHATALELDHDGRIVFGAWGEFFSGQVTWLIGRLTPAGQVDVEFNGGLLKLLSFGEITGYNDDRLADLAIRADNGIVGAGQAWFPASRIDAAFASITESGDLDLSFGLNGKTLANFGPVNADASYSWAVDLLIEPDTGFLTFAGSSRSFVAGDEDRFSVAGRIDTTGLFDPSFNGSGFLVVTGEALEPLTFITEGAGITRYSDGSYLLASSYWVSSSSVPWRGMLTKILPSGTVSIVWGEFGHHSVLFGSLASSTISSLVLDGAERPLCVGVAAFADGPLTGYARFEGDLPDERFRGHGLTNIDLSPFPLSKSLGSDLAVDPGGRFLIIGTTYFNYNASDEFSRATIARFFNGLPFADDFESGSTYRWSVTASP